MIFDAINIYFWRLLQIYYHSTRLELNAAKGAMIAGGVGLIAGGNDRNHRRDRRQRPNHHRRRGN